MPDSSQQLVAVVVFLAAYAVIVTDKIHRTIVALFAGFLIVALGIVSQHAAFAHIDLNVIFLLAGMMVIANVLERSGFFQWLSVQMVRVTGAQPYRMLVALSLLTAILSALLDNVTAVVLLAPIAFSTAERRGMPPLPLLISIVLASNIGGTATLIGDPPNIIIGSAFDKDFVAFLLHTAPAALVSLVAYLLIARWLFRDDLRARRLSAEELRSMLEFDARTLDRSLAARSLAVLGLTIVGFLLARPLGLEGATIALMGASAVLLVSRVEVHDVLAHVEWPTLFFFIGLFVLVGGLVDTGVIGALASAVLNVTARQPEVTALAVLWLSAIVSGIVKARKKRYASSAATPEPSSWRKPTSVARARRNRITRLVAGGGQVVGASRDSLSGRSCHGWRGRGAAPLRAGLSYRSLEPKLTSHGTS